MKMFSLLDYLRLPKINYRYALNSRANIASISFISCSIPFFFMGQFITGIALSLGSIACGLSDTASVTKHRRSDFVLSLVLLFINTLAVNYFFSNSIVFTLYLALSSFMLFMLAIYSPRLGAIGFATILSGIYAMLLYNPSQSVWYIPTALMLGGVWYGIWQWFIGKWLPHQDDKDLLYEIYQVLGKKLVFHSRPLIDKTVSSYDNFIASGKMRSVFIVKYNELQNRVHQQLSASENSPQLALILPAMRAAENIAEQTRLMHFSPSLIFRKNNSESLSAMNDVTHQLAQVLKKFKNGKPQNLAKIDFSSIRLNLKQRRIKGKIQLRELSLAEAFVDHLELIYLELQKLINRRVVQGDDVFIKDDKLAQKLNIKNRVMLKWQQFMSQFTFQSSYFRHALRGTLCLTTGFILVRLFKLDFGFWTLMTSLLVLKPNLSMTWLRLLNRVAGTLCGLGAVALLLYFQVPDYVLPIVFCIAAILFFHTTARQYGFSVFCVTLFVFSGFALNGEGNVIILPRLENTFLGVILPVIFVLLISPGWQKDSFPQQLLNTVRGYLCYLSNLKLLLENEGMNNANYKQTLLPYFQRCIRDDTNLFNHWLGYLGEPKQKNTVSEAILLCCHSSNIMLRILTLLNGQLNQVNSSELISQLDKTIALFSQLDNRLVYFIKSPYFFNYFSEHKKEISPRLQELELQGGVKEPEILLSLLQKEISTFLL